MSLRVSWDAHSHRIIVVDFVNGWTWQDLYAIQGEAHQMIDTVQHDVGVIFQGFFGMAIPPYAVTQGQKLLENKHPRTQAFVVVGATTIARAVFNVYNRMYWHDPSRQFTLVDTLEQARAHLFEQLKFVPTESEKLMGVPFN